MRSDRRPARVGLLLVLALSACRQDMFNQPKARTYRASDFFSDGMSARPPVPGTVARGQLHADRILESGIGNDGRFVTALPVPLSRDLLERGRQRYEIFCAPCHGRVGDGRGMIVERGFKEPPSYHIDRLRAQPVGYFFDVMTNGFGQMAAYAPQIPPADRWAIAAHLRALQLSQHAVVPELPEQDRRAIDRAAAAPAETAGEAGK